MDRNLAPIAAKVEAGQRLSFEEGVTLFHTPDVHTVQRLAHMVRTRLHGAKTYYNINTHLEPTNKCVFQCRFCAFAKKINDPEGYAWTVDEVLEHIRNTAPINATEIHIVGGLHSKMRTDYYCDLFRAIRREFPHLHIKALTAVEVDFFARMDKTTHDDVLRRLMDAGLGSMPGGGAEIFDPEIWDQVCKEKPGFQNYLAVHRTAHSLGLKSNCTMLYGHIESVEHRVDHMIRLRELQDETGGFQTFIPLAFNPMHTDLEEKGWTTGLDDLRTIAVSRLMLDNIPHIKTYWIMVGAKTAQVALSWGANDIDGTVTEEQITHAAGADTPQTLTVEKLEHLVREAGLVPVERDTLYNEIRRDEAEAPSPVSSVSDVAQAPSPVSARRMSYDEAVELMEHCHDLAALGEAAHAVRMQKHPDDVVTYIVDRNINYSNVCTEYCKFCAFYRPKKNREAYILDRDVIASKMIELREAGGRQTLLQGGIHPDLGIEWYEDLLRWMRAEFPDIAVHGFSPPEIYRFAEISGIPLRDTIARLRDAGLQSIPGGGAEILTEQSRMRLSPLKITTDQWLEVMQTAHQLGLRTSATMMFGHGEEMWERIEHLDRLRRLQDETGGFTAFICWTFQEENTAMEGKVPLAGAHEYLRMLSIARLYLDNFDNMQASWVTQGAKIGQVALFHGANDMGSTMLEENVVSAAGTTFHMDAKGIERIVRDAGFRPQQRDFFYEHVEPRVAIEV